MALDEQTSDRLTTAVEEAIAARTKGQQHAHQSKHMVPMRGPHLALSLEEIALVGAMLDAALKGRAVRLTAPTRAQAQSIFVRVRAAMNADTTFREPAE